MQVTDGRENLPARYDIERTRERRGGLATGCGCRCGVVNFALEDNASQNMKFPINVRLVKGMNLNVVYMTAHCMTRVVYCKTGYCAN